MSTSEWVKRQFLLCAIVYQVGLTLTAICQFLRLTGHLEIHGLENLHQARRPVILAHNHPSLLESILMPVLFFFRWWWNPWRAPWSTPDLNNYGRWLWWLLPRAIFFDRGSLQGESAALRQAREVLQAGGDIIISPEGGRTFSGSCHVKSKGGKLLRKLKGGTGWLIAEVGDVSVVTVWIEGTDKVLPNKADVLYWCWPRFWGNKMVIKIGPSLRFCPGMSKEEITESLQAKLLELADT